MQEQNDIPNIGYITSSEAALRYHCSKDYISRLCREGKLKGYMLGRNWFIEREAFEDFYSKKDSSRAEALQRLAEVRKHEYELARKKQALARQSFETPTPRIAQNSFLLVNLASTVSSTSNIPPILRRSFAEDSVLIFFQKAATAMFALIFVFGAYGLVALPHNREAIGEAPSFAQALVTGNFSGIQDQALTERASSLAASIQAAAEARSGFFGKAPEESQDLFARAISNATKSFSSSLGFFATPVAPTRFSLVPLPQKQQSGVTKAPIVLAQNTPVQIIYRDIQAPARTVITQAPQAAGVSQNYVDTQLQILKNSLSSEIFKYSSALMPTVSQNMVNLAQAQRIDLLTRTTLQSSTFNNGIINDGSINNASIFGGSISGASLNVTDITVVGPSTFGGVLTLPYLNATSTTATSTFSGNLTVSQMSTFARFISNASSTIGDGTQAGGLTIYGGATTTSNAYFGGTLGIGTTTPTSNFSVQGNSYISGTSFFGGAITATSTLNIGGATTLSSTLGVSGLSTFAGLISTASSTIGAGGQTTGLTIYGGATTTSNAYFGGTLGIGTTTPAGAFGVQGNGFVSGTFTAGSIIATSSFTLGGTGSSGGFAAYASSTIGAGTQTTGLTISGGATTTGNAYVVGGFGVGIATSAPGVLQTSSHAYIGGNLFVAGNSATIGNSSSNTLVVNSSIQSHLVPDQNITYDLGSSSFYWRNVYVGNLNANNISAANTTISGTQSSTFTINSDNATSDTEDQDLIFFRGNVVPNGLLSWKSTANRFEFNQPLFIQNASTDNLTGVTLDLKGLSGQTGALFNVASSTGTSVFAINSAGLVGVGTTTPTNTLAVHGTSYVSGSSFFGGAITATSTFALSGVATLSGGLTAYASSTIGAGGATTGLTISGGATTTGNAYFAGNVGVGAIAPVAKLQVTGSSGAFIGNGAEGIFSITTGTGVSTSNKLEFGVVDGLYSWVNASTPGTASRSLVLNPGLGNVGIGSTTPYATLSVKGAGSAAGVNFQTTNSSDSPLFTILDNGNVGIGTTTALGLLHLQGAGQTTAAFDTNSLTNSLVLDDTGQSGGNGGALVFSAKGYRFAVIKGLLINGAANGQGDIAFSTRAASTDSTLTERMRIAVNGRVGIGTTGPEGELEIANNASGAEGATLVLKNNSTALNTAVGLYFVPNGASALARAASIKSRQTTSGNFADLGFFTANSDTPVERLTITAAGNVGIGTTSPFGTLSLESNGGAQFVVKKSAGGGDNYVRSNFYNSTGDYWQIAANPNTTAASSILSFFSGSGGANVLNLLGNGNVGIGTANPAKALSVEKEVLVNGNNSSGIEHNDWPHSSLSIRRSDDYVANGVTMVSLGYRNDPTYLTDNSVANIRLWDLAQGPSASVSANTTELKISSPGPLSLGSGGTADRFYVDATGNIGIGSTTPYAKLSVKGAGSTTGVNFQTTNSSDSPLFTILDSGNVGIGTTTPGALLDVNGVARINNGTVVSGDGLDVGTGMRATRSGSGAYVAVERTDAGESGNSVGSFTGVGLNSASTRKAFSNISMLSNTITNGIEIGEMRFQNLVAGTLTDVFNIVGGNVGIGTTTPFKTLTVAGASKQILITDTGTIGSDSSGFKASTYSLPTGADQRLGFLIFGGDYANTERNTVAIEGMSGAAWTDAASYSSYLKFSTTPAGAASRSERMRIDPSGNVGIGTTSPWGLLSVNANAIGTGPQFVIGSSTKTDFIVTNAGNVGIGLPTAANPLSVSKTGVGTLASFYRSDAASTDNADILLGRSSASGESTTLRYVYHSSTPYFNIFHTGDATGTGLVVLKGGNIGIGTTTPWRKFNITDAVSTAQMTVAYDTTRYTDFLTSSVGDLTIAPQGQDINTLDSNLWICTGGSCPSGAPTGTGNIIVENKIGVGTTTPAFLLTIESQNANDNLFQIATTTNQRVLVVNNNGQVGVGTSSPTTQFSISDRLFVGASGATGMGTATSTFQGDIKITGKLDVATIDPVYTIDAVKYATYGHSTIGIKEEAVALLDVSERNPKTGKYEKRISFKEVEKGSDLWLFYQITDFGHDWKNLVINLTTSFDGSVFYTKVPSEAAVIISASEAGEVSARFIANRFDSDKWPNIRPDQDDSYKGHEIQTTVGGQGKSVREAAPVSAEPSAQPFNSASF